MTSITVPAREGRAVSLGRGRRLRIATPKGRQAADFFAFNADDIAEWLSPMHSWVSTRSLRPRAGDLFLSRRRRPIIRFLEDGAGGVHDMLIAACDQARYAEFGHAGYHPSCSENLETALAGLGHRLPVVPQPVNFFTHTRVEPDGRLLSPPNPVAPGAFVVLEALMETICVVSACPFDLAIEGWTINADTGPSELLLTLD